MPHGLPDWGLEGPKSTTFGLDDLGEAAVRLGSPHLWDRRGDVVWDTVFANGLEGAEPEALGALSDHCLWTGNARQGAYCVRLIADADAGDFAAIRKFLPHPTQISIGLEFSFSCRVTMTDWYLRVTGAHPTGTFEAAIRIDVANDDLYYWDGLPNWVLFAEDVRLFSADYILNTAKMVFEWANHEYVRFILNDVEYSLTGFPYRFTAAAADKRMLIHCELREGGLAVTTGYLDSVIVTQNEP